MSYNDDEELKIGDISEIDEEEDGDIDLDDLSDSVDDNDLLEDDDLVDDEVAGLDGSSEY